MSVTQWIAETALKAIPSHGPGAGRKIVRGLIEQKKFTPESLHLTELGEGVFGVRGEALANRLRLAASNRSRWAGEAVEAVDLTAWRDIVGAVATESMTQGYTEVNSPVDQLVGTWESEDGDPVNELLIPFPSAATDPSQDVAPGMEYPKTGFAHYSIVAPVPVKHGLIAQLTLEVVMANRRRQFLDAMAEVGRVCRLEEVRRKLRLVLGITNNYTTQTADGTRTTRDTYVTTAGAANLLNDLDLTDPAEIDRLQQVFASMEHPLTGEPIDVMPTAVFTTRGNYYASARAASVDEIRITNGSAVSISASPVSLAGPILTDVRAQRLLESEAGIEGTALSTTEAATFLATGDFQRAFKWRQVRPFETFEAGPGEANETAAGTFLPAFYQDVVYACKGRWWGAGFVADPYSVMAAYDAD